jgi:predicted alpha/beta-fold hydrolase
MVVVQVGSLTMAPHSLIAFPFSGHLQTMYCVTGDFSKQDQVTYDR